MSRFVIYSKDGSTERYAGAPKYSGTYLGVSYIEFSSISSPTPINWEVGDYVDYFRTGFRYRLHTIPEPNKQARAGEYGSAFVYNNVKFYEATKDLEVALFRDLVPEDNKIHFSTRQDFSTYENVYGLARRIQECMDDLFPNKWRIEVFDTDDANVLALFNETKEFSVSGGSCLDALSQIYDQWDNVGWIYTYDSASEQDVITIGRNNVRDSQNTTDSFAYGKGQGLTAIKKAAANEGEFATRLYVYGSDRNIQTRYYNTLEIKDKDSVDIRNLMIPISEWGLTDGVPDARKAYLQADDAIIEKYGLIPRVVYFDGSDNEEIYPSIVGLTESKVREYMIAAGEGNSKYLPPATENRIDKVRSAEFANDKGSEEEMKANPTFKLGTYSFGFNVVEQGKKTSEGRAVISMKSGKCAGRDFVIKTIGVDVADFDPILIVERTWDESLGMGFPNSIYTINEGDEFVLLDIPMPDYYISIASDKLLEAGQKMLADYTRVSAYYEPSIDPIKIKDGGKLLREGLYMAIYDQDIVDTDDNIDYVLIDSLSIDESTQIPTYRVTLREQKRSLRNFAALEDMIEDAEKVTKEEFNRQRNYTERRFRSALETISLLEGAIEGFTDGVNPVTVQTMSVLLGSESLQFIFTESRSSLKQVPCPLSYNAATKQLTSVPASLIHKTIGTTEIVPEGTRSASDYKSWDVDGFNSEVYEDNEPRYVYVRASISDPEDAKFVTPKKAIGLNEETGYYHFLAGILSSEVSGIREFVPMYGFTEILPGQISTDVIRSSDGKTYFDLVKGEIGGVIKFSAGSSGLENIDGLTEAIQNSVGGLEFGKYNLLRNSGFTGDFVTESLDNKTILDKDSQMFSDPLTHWTASNVSVQDSEVGQSGKEVILSNGILSQTLKDKVIVGENYVLTFRAKGQRLSYSVGGVSGAENLSSEWQKYIIKFKAESSESVFSISNATAIICDLQLERGTVQSAWGHSMYDNQSELAKYQALAYLESAIKDGSSTVQGGLILSNLIMLGNVGKQDNTAGVSGIYNNDDDVAFWGGGTWQQAIQTAIRYAENPLYKPTDKEMSSLAKFIITHGGRAILNEAVVRGKVYADSGNIGGFELSGNRIGTTDKGLSLSTSYLAFRDNDEDTLASRFSAIGENVLPSTMGIYGLSRFEIESSDSFDKSYGSAVGVYSSIKGYKKPYAYYCPNGQFAGLRPRFRRVVLPANELIEKIDHTIEVFGNNAAEGTLTLPTGPEDGQCYEIWKWGSCALTIKAQDTNVVRLGVSANPTQGIGADFVGIIKIIFSKEASNQWLMTLCRTE